MRAKIREQKEAKKLRKKGLTHREIAEILKVAKSSAYQWTKDVRINSKQKKLIEQKRNRHVFTKGERRRGGLKSPQKFKAQYSKRELLQKIQQFYLKNKRIPTKREVSSHRPYVRIFGSWNKAIKAAGFNSNPVKFARRRTAFDGHKCDSFAEFIIDNWLYRNDIPHQVHVFYPDNKMTADFLVNGTRIEFIGLEGEIKKYDKLLKKKRSLTKKLDLKVIEIYPKDLFPENKLDKKLMPLLAK